MKVRSRAVTLGRYQPPTIAHLDTVQTILRQWDELTIGILHNETPRESKLRRGGLSDCEYLEYMTLADRNWTDGRNPYSLTERVDMWLAVVHEYSLADRVKVTSLSRPEIAPQEFEMLFNSTDFDLVFPISSGHSPFDLTRNRALAAILQRPVHTVIPEVEIHNSLIRKLAQYEISPSLFVPRGAREIRARVDLRSICEDEVPK